MYQSTQPSVLNKIVFFEQKDGYLIDKYLFFYNITPSGLKTQALPIFYNHSTPSGLKYLALNPKGVTYFFVQMAKWQIRTLFLLRYKAYSLQPVADSRQPAAHKACSLQRIACSQ
jgi:hypothetical protein